MSDGNQNNKPDQLIDEGNTDIASELSNIHNEISYLSDMFVRRLKDDKQKNQLIESLSNSVNNTFIESFLSDIIRLLDRLEKSDDDFVCSIHDELFDIIHKRGVALIENNSVFDPKINRVIRTIESDELSDGAIVDVVRKGYSFNGKVIRPIEVVVSKSKE